MVGVVNSHDNLRGPLFGNDTVETLCRISFCDFVVQELLERRINLSFALCEFFSLKPCHPEQNVGFYDPMKIHARWRCHPNL